MNKIIEKIENGTELVVEKLTLDGEVKFNINQKLKEEIVSLFKQSKNVIQAGDFKWEDKLEWRTDNSGLDFRVCPGAWIRRGVSIGKNCIFMPCFVNIGAHIGENTMIDSGVTVGACSYVGKNCHISSYAVIAGVLEPMQAKPAIIDDNCFIGAGCIISEGMVIGAGSVLGAGLVLTSSTKIINRVTGEVTYGNIPAGSKVVPGSYASSRGLSEKDLTDSILNINCAVILGGEINKDKTSLNSALRD